MVRLLRRGEPLEVGAVEHVSSPALECLRGRLEGEGPPPTRRTPTRRHVPPGSAPGLSRIPPANFSVVAWRFHKGRALELRWEEQPHLI